MRSFYAQRQIAQRCLYGVDKNPMATDLAKLSLWLATLAKDHPFTFLDHSLRSGDSLVGLSRRQITAFHWDKTDAQMSFLRKRFRKKSKPSANPASEILTARDDVPYALLTQKMEKVEDDLSLPAAHWRHGNCGVLFGRKAESARGGAAGVTGSDGKDRAQRD